MPWRVVTRRDTLLVLLGAGCVHLFSLFSVSDFIGDRGLFSDASSRLFEGAWRHNVSRTASFPLGGSGHEDASGIPETAILSHAPGWTVFEDIYMSNGTLFIVSDQPASKFPETRLMISTGLPGYNTPENLAAREPTEYDLTVITHAEAQKRWGNEDGSRSHNLRTVDGNTFLVADPDQFLQHYYHFAGELLVGAWAFWHGTLSRPQGGGHPVPMFDRIIFSHTGTSGWRDLPGFNHYFVRAAFPNAAIETVDDWEDRIGLSVPPSDDPHVEQLGKQKKLRPLADDWAKVSGFRGAQVHREMNAVSRAWHFPRLLLADRSAAHRGWWCGAKTQRTASEALVKLRELGWIGTGRGWWEQIRKAVVEYAGGDSSADDGRGSIVLTYISRQGDRRSLRKDDHERLVKELKAFVALKNFEAPLQGTRTWELSVVKAQRLSKDEQIRLAARTTILLGPHGNGLTHMLLMRPSKYSAVIELFPPGSWAHDYEWTAHTALNMSYYGITNTTFDFPPRSYDTLTHYTEDFHGTEMPVDASTVKRVLEYHVALVEGESQEA